MREREGDCNENGDNLKFQLIFRLPFVLLWLKQKKIVLTVDTQYLKPFILKNKTITKKFPGFIKAIVFLINFPQILEYTKILIKKN